VAAESQFDSQQGQEIFFFSNMPSWYSLGIGALSWGVKQLGYEADHSPSSNTVAKNDLMPL
jgi:hypothetical protein